MILRAWKCRIFSSRENKETLQFTCKNFSVVIFMYRCLMTQKTVGKLIFLDLTFLICSKVKPDYKIIKSTVILSKIFRHKVHLFRYKSCGCKMGCWFTTQPAHRLSSSLSLFLTVSQLLVPSYPLYPSLFLSPASWSIIPEAIFLFLPRSLLAFSLSSSACVSLWSYNVSVSKWREDLRKI